MLNLNCVMLGSEDPKALGDFYGKVLEKKPDMEEGDFIGFLAGSCFLSVGPHDKVSGKNSNPERIIFFFETTDIDADFNRIKDVEGATVVQEPYSPGDDDTMKLATLADPDGNYFQLSTPWNG
jgi:predicted enzyme related to lactoylglutathione lyase